MRITMKQVLDGLGLMPFEEYASCPKRLEWVKQMMIHTPIGQSVARLGLGQTTHMICRLLVYLSKIEDLEKKVYISGHSPSYTRTLCTQAREYAERVGLDPMRIMPFIGSINRGHFQRFYIFQDHYIPPRGI